MPKSPNLSKEFLRACQRGDLRALKEIIKLRDVEDWTIYRYDVSGDTGLHLAAREGHLEVVKFLCEEWKKPAFRADVTNRDMKRPLHEAAQFSRFGVVDYLIRQGVMIDSLKRADWTPLMLACTKSGKDAAQCVEKLLDAGADPCRENSDGWNSLLIACRTGDSDSVKLLLQREPKCINTRSKNGRSALHIAAFHGSIEIIDLLINTDPKILNDCDSSGSSALLESAKSGNLQITKKLCDFGADIKASDDVGNNILHIAAASGSVDIVEYILANKLIDLHSENRFGLTPMMSAQRFGKKSVVDLLTKFGANK